MGAMNTLERLRVQAVRVGRVSLAGRLRKEINRCAGYTDRQRGAPCRSANGAYLDGWYDSDGSLYYVTQNELEGLFRS